MLKALDLAGRGGGIVNPLRVADPKVACERQALFPHAPPGDMTVPGRNIESPS
ncbi:MAG TPA: hypothetical protein VEI57_14205 [Nitrospirota bacterium]|nr:hypothetical protein [Nitrospirota bacterium]